MDLTYVYMALLATAVAADPTRFVFSFGDSYTSTGFAPTGQLPAIGTPFGNPGYPGDTTTGTNEPNYIGTLIHSLSPSDTLSWNFAYGGATVDNSLATQGQSVPDFKTQVDEFKQYVTQQNAAWTASNSVFTSYFGTNDISVKYDEMSTDASVIQNIIYSYFGALETLYEAGARRFVIFSMSPVYRVPEYQTIYASRNETIKADVGTWNNMLSYTKDSFAANHADADVRMIDSMTIFNTILDNPTANGAPDNVCENTDGTSCLWYNYLHPGVKIQQALANSLYETLQDMDVFSTS